jgi:exonuclease SbcD
MKKPIALISNDWHLEPTNTALVIAIIKDMIQQALDLKITEIFVLGDIFDDRKSQRQIVLNAFRTILNMFEESGLNVSFITGNHDRSDYTSNESFLSPFHSDKIPMIDDFCIIEDDNHIYKLAPFFNENIWIKKFEEFALPLSNSKTRGDKKKILLTHVGFQGSINNDGSIVNTPIKPTLFKDYDLVLSGHYHNQQQVAPNVYHLPSLYQRNYGEDDDKGFTILYDDLSFELIKSQFDRFEKVVIDLDTISKKDLEEKTRDFSAIAANGHHVRFEFRGTEKKVKAIKKEIFTSNGIDVKTKIKEIEEVDIQFNDEVKKLDIQSLYDKFTNFCEKEDLDLEIGQKYLSKVLEE